MPLVILNEVDVFNSNQAEWDSKDIDILVASYDRTGVISGAAVTAQGTPDMTVAVAGGVVVVAGTRATIVAANVTITAASATNPRFDLIVSSDAGALSATAGTAAAEPVFPSIPASSVVLATVYVPANDTTIQTNQITDKRVILGYGPLAPSYITVATDSMLPNERTLTGTANQINTVDGGAGGAFTLSAPQNIHTTATPQFAGLGLGVAGVSSQIAGTITIPGAWTFSSASPIALSAATPLLDATAATANLTVITRRTAANTGIGLTIQSLSGVDALTNRLTLTSGVATAVWDFANTTISNANLTTPTISATGFTNATHPHTAASSGGTIAIVDTTGTLAIARGGTNAITALNNSRIMVSSAGGIVEAAVMTNGQLLIGSTAAAPVVAALTGTANQVTVTNGAGSITLTTPQNIHTAATPQFLRLGLNQTADASARMAATGQYFSVRFALTDGATIALDWNNGNVQSVTLGGNRTFTFANPKDGGRYVIILAQDATGSRTITWPTIKWQGGTAPTLTTTANKKDIITIVYDGTDYLGGSSLNY